MSKIVSKNLRDFLKATGRKKEWVIDRMGIDKNSFEKMISGEEESFIHLEKFAKLFRRNTQEFYEENMKLPLTIEQIQEKHKDEVITPPSDMMLALSDAEEIQNNLNKAYGFMSDEKENSTLFTEVKNLLEEMKAKTELFLEESEHKYWERESK